MVLTSNRYDVDPDAARFAEFATERGWSDGLPMIPPTIERVAKFVEVSGMAADTVIGQIPPVNAACTVELIAINAVMAGAPAEAMPLLIAAVAAVVERDHNLFGNNATTAPVVSALIVNGPARHKLNIAHGAGCFGGAEGSNVSIGRALRLIIRNVGGQRIGTTSKSVFGQPARITGIVVGEWEEQSPWPPLAERHGLSGNAVTAVSANGTLNIADGTSNSADLLLDRIGRSLPYPGSNGYRPHAEYCTITVAINPVWARIIASSYPNVEDVQLRLWEIASIPVGDWPEEHQARLIDADMVLDSGRVPVVRDPDKLLVIVCGGGGSLHAMAMHGMSSVVPITKQF